MSAPAYNTLVSVVLLTDRLCEAGDRLRKTIDDWAIQHLTPFAADPNRADERARVWADFDAAIRSRREGTT